MMISNILNLNFKKRSLGKFLFINFIWLSIFSFLVSAASAGTNLISNPGFESGTGIPFNWTFITQNGNIPTWDSTVYHNGSRSIKISIPGTTEITSGYPKSDLIRVNPLTYYTFSAWGKTQNVLSNAIAVRIVELDINKKRLSQRNIDFNKGTNNWIQKQIDFQTGSNTAYVYVYANIWNSTGTFWVDDIGLRLKSNLNSSIQINSDKTLSINGIRTFPVFMYNICNAYFELEGVVEPCNPSKNSEFSFSGGGEYYWNFKRTDLRYKFENAKKYYNIMAKNTDINLIPPEIINSSSFFGYMLDDEPDVTQINSIKNNYNYIKTKDKKHPVMLYHWMNMTQWSPYTDILIFDYYTIKSTTYWTRNDSIYAYEHYSEQSFFKGTNLNSINKPVWALIQGNGLPQEKLIIPKNQEVRANTYTAITMDFKGIGFWSYLGWGGSLTPTTAFPNGTPGLYNNPQLHAYYRQLAKELNSLNNILVLPTKDYSWEYHKGTNVLFSKNLTKKILWKTRTNFNYMLKQSGTTYYLIVVNKDSRPISNVGITITGLTGSKVATTLGLEKLGSGRAGRVLNVYNGKFTDSFDGFAVHIYKVV